MNEHASKGFDRDDPLWDVLDRARKPAPVDPWFAQKVLRAIDEEKPAPTGWRSWFASWSISWVPVAASIAIAVAGLHYVVPTSPPLQSAIGDALPAQPDERVAAVLEDLEALVALEDGQGGLEDALLQQEGG